MKKKWDIKSKIQNPRASVQDVIDVVLKERGIASDGEKQMFISPPDPYTFTAYDVGIDTKTLENAIERIEKAVQDKESIIVYADYDADGVTAGAVMWETLHALGAKVMPYIPHRKDEGYGLSTIGIDSVKKDYNATFIITVDHGITGHGKVAYANSLGIDVVVTDHHTKPSILPDCPIVHTTMLSGSGVSWFVAKTLLERNQGLLQKEIDPYDLLSLASIGTIADLLPLIGPNRSIAKFGLAALSNSSRFGVLAMLEEAGLSDKELSTYEVSHIIAPRINALGRIDHALDALRLLCTTSEERALVLSEKLAAVNKERQNLTQESTIHAKELVISEKKLDSQKIIIIADESYNQGIIGLIAGKLVEEHYLPTIVLAKGEKVSKASARSIAGFNIVEAIRSQLDLLVDVGGHPMAAGFTIETDKLSKFITNLEEYAKERITEDMIVRSLSVDVEMPLSFVTAELFSKIQQLAPFGMNNYEPTFASFSVALKEARLVGKEGKHLKLSVINDRKQVIEAIAFNMGSLLADLQNKKTIDIAFTITNNVWNGKEKIELKVKDLRIP